MNKEYKIVWFGRILLVKLTNEDIDLLNAYTDNDLQIECTEGLDYFDSIKIRGYKSITNVCMEGSFYEDLYNITGIDNSNIAREVRGCYDVIDVCNETTKKVYRKKAQRGIDILTRRLGGTDANLLIWGKE